MLRISSSGGEVGWEMLKMIMGSGLSSGKMSRIKHLVIHNRQLSSFEGRVTGPVFK